MSQLQVSGEAKIRDIQGPVVANSGVITALDGAASQYVRGDGTLADFPTSTGGGSSVSYYLNSSVSQGTIGGVAYRELSKEPIIGAGTDIAISANGYVANYITDVNDPDVVLIPGGNFNCEFYFSVNNNTGNPFFYAELYKYDGTTFTLLGSSVGVPEYITQGTTIAPYYFAIPVATATLALTDRLAIRIYVNVSGRTVTLHTENGHLCQVVTTLSKGMVSLNNLTDQSQFLTTGTSGTNFAIVSSGDTHTFNLPVASATNTGKLSSTDWSTFNGKVPYTGAIADVDLGVYSLTANKLIAGSASTDNVAIFTTYDEGKAIQLKSSTGDLLFVPFFNPATGARIIAQNTAGSAYTPLSFYASNFYFQSNVNFNSTIGNGTYTYTLPSATGTLALTSQLTGGTVTSVGLSSATSGVTIGSSPITTSGTITLAIATASGSQNGLLSSTDWTTFNNKQNAITLTTTGTSGAATLVGSTLNIPNYGSALSDYVTIATNQTITGVKTFTNDITGQSNIFVTNQEGGVYADYFGRYSTGSTPLTFVYGSTGSVLWGNGGVKMTLTSAGALQVASSLSATSATLNGNVTINSTAAALSPLQVVATGTIVRLGEQSGTTGKQLLIGIDATSGRSELQSVWQGTGFTSLALQPSGGNVLIGATGDNGARLQVTGTSTYQLPTSGGAIGSVRNLTLTNTTGSIGDWAGINFAYYNNGTNFAYIGSILSNENSNAAADLVFGVKASNSATSVTEYMRIKFGGNVGIGTSSPEANSQLTLYGSSFSQLHMQNGTTGTGSNGFRILMDGNNLTMTNREAGYWAFETSDTERMRITSEGNVLIGKTSTNVDTGDGVRFDANGSIFTSIVTGEASYYLRDITNSVYRFYVTSGGTINATNTTISAISDVRLKENISDLEIGLDAIMALRPRKFDWKKQSGNSGKNIRGFIAQEFEEIFPDLIDESINPAPEGEEPYKQIRQDLIPILVKAMQQQQAQIQELEARIKQLENK